MARAGRIGDARAIVGALDESAAERYVSRLTLALAHAAIGERERALVLLEEAEEERSASFALSLFGPGFLALSPEWVGEWFARRREHLRRSRSAAPTESGTSAQKRG